MLLRVRARRPWRLTAEVAVLMGLVAGPYVVSALASTGTAPTGPAPAQAPRSPPSPGARGLAPLLANTPVAPATETAPAPLTPEAARLWNAAIPLSEAPNPAARPYRLASAGALDAARATDCMTAAVYYEAGEEGVDGQRAVAQVVLNRMRDPQFPKTVCDVVFEGSDGPGCQFTFTCDGALDRPPSEEGWARARKVAAAALHGYVMKTVGGATHYHADYVAPAWAPALVKVAVVGQHIFYRWPSASMAAGRQAGGEATTLKVASLDAVPPSLGKLPLTPVAAAPAAEPEVAAAPVEVAPAKPAATVESAGERMVDAGAVAAAQAGPALASDLDWQGRPRQKGPPRLARPDAF